MDFFKTRHELRQMGIKDLLQMTTNQKIQKCIIINHPCRYYFRYSHFTFCVSEILGESCQVERLHRLEETLPKDKRKFLGPPLFQKLEVGSGLPEKKALRFKVYWRDRHTRSIALLGSVTERRKKERIDNLGDLLKKVVNDFSEQVDDPSGIFLLDS